MRRLSSGSILIGLAVAVCLAAALAFSATTAGMTAGKANLQSAGAMAFGPDGVLFVGDSLGAAVFAIDTADTKPAGAPAKLEIKGINEKIAAMLGTAADQIAINDLKVNPVSKNIYLSASRGRGPDAIPVILRVDGAGKIAPLALDNVKYSMVALPNAPASQSGQRSARVDTITEIAYVDGNVLVAGLSNEEFSSNLRTIPFPFHGVSKGANVEIFHGSHGQYETNSPVRTFVPYTINNQSYILAAYTCTPLVKIPVSELKPGNKVKGTTIAEFGYGNRPLDMVAYRKDGHEYLLMSNSNRGVMKVSADHLDTYKPITAPVTAEIAGVPYKTIAELQGVQHLEKFDEGSALILASAGKSMDLRTVPLP
jgi:hypothetical protein